MLSIIHFDGATSQKSFHSVLPASAARAAKWNKGGTRSELKDGSGSAELVHHGFIDIGIN